MGWISVKGTYSERNFCIAILIWKANRKESAGAYANREKEKKSITSEITGNLKVDDKANRTPHLQIERQKSRAYLYMSIYTYARSTWSRFSHCFMIFYQFLESCERSWLIWNGHSPDQQYHQSESQYYLPAEMGDWSSWIMLECYGSTSQRLWINLIIPITISCARHKPLFTCITHNTKKEENGLKFSKMSK